MMVCGYWIHCATTEAKADGFSSIVRIANGTAPQPFVRRRLAVDLSRALAAVVPASLWDAAGRALEGDTGFAKVVRRGLAVEAQKWNRQDYPVLFSAYLLIGCSVVGFMYVCRSLIGTFYQTPDWLADLLGALFGVALLGGNGDWHYYAYPYDFPNALCFALALKAIVDRRWWFWLVFALAAYSKETAILLIPAYALRNPEDRTRKAFWLKTGGLLLLFVAIRSWIALTYVVPSPPFWPIARNGRQIVKTVLGYGWLLPAIGVSVFRMYLMRKNFPPYLLRLLSLLALVVCAALFKGWIEELRQYLEFLPVVGMLVIQWTFNEAGLGALFQPRMGKERGTAEPAPSFPGAPSHPGAIEQVVGLLRSGPPGAS
jgi:hypothetical protein